MRRAILACGCAALALAACSKTETKTTTTPDGTVSTSTSSNGSASVSLSPPMRKAGLWEQTMTLNGAKLVQSTRMCLDNTTEAKMKWWATENRRGGADCSEQNISPKAGGWSFHSVCKMGDGATVTSDGQATGDFGSHYTVDVTSTTSGSAMAQSNGVHKISMEGTWKGPCPADMKPGDIEMPGGMKFNMVDATNRAAAAPEGFKPGQRPTPEQMQQMRAQAMEMAKRMKAQGAQ